MASWAVRVPEAGGLYLYIRDAFGSLPAFLYGWALFFLISSGSVATLAVAFSLYLGQVFPLSFVAEKVVAASMIAILAVVNVWGTRPGANAVVPRGTSSAESCWRRNSHAEMENLTCAAQSESLPSSFECPLPA
jgi:amino acid transporter